MLTGREQRTESALRFSCFGFWVYFSPCPLCAFLTWKLPLTWPALLRCADCAGKPAGLCAGFRENLIRPKPEMRESEEKDGSEYREDQESFHFRFLSY